jgi:hypothetical protein
MRFVKKIMLLLGATSFASIGFVRGFKTSKYNSCGEQRLYVDRALSGALTAFVYINPITAPYVVVREARRMEVGIRNIPELRYPTLKDELFITDYTHEHTALLLNQQRKPDESSEW